MAINKHWMWKHSPLIYISRKRCKIKYSDLKKYMSKQGYYTEDTYAMIRQWGSIIFVNGNGDKIIIEVLSQSLDVHENEIYSLIVYNFMKV